MEELRFHSAIIFLVKLIMPGRQWVFILDLVVAVAAEINIHILFPFLMTIGLALLLSLLCSILRIQTYNQFLNMATIVYNY